MDKKSKTGTNLISEMFHSETKVNKFSKDLLDPKNWPPQWKRIYPKTYPRFNTIELPKEIDIITHRFADVLLSRKSERKFNNKPVTFNDLSALLFYSAGIIPNSGNNIDNSRRFYPSAGARYPLEIYIESNNIESLPKGLYHYNPINHSLDILIKNKNLKTIVTKLTGQDWVSKAQFVIFISAIYERTKNKYGERGYRHILIETGHLGQNIYLVATSLGLKVCAIGGFIDDKINRLIDIDEEYEAVLYTLAVGC